MTFEKYFKIKTVGLELKNYPSIELILKDAWNTAIKECAKIVESEKERADIMGMDEYFSACEYIVKEIASREA